MNVTITSRTHPLTDQMKSFIDEKIAHLAIHEDKEGSGHLIVSQVRHEYSTELVLRVNGTVITSRSNGDDLRKSIEEVCDKAGRQMEKLKEKRRER